MVTVQYNTPNTCYMSMRNECMHFSLFKLEVIGCQIVETLHLKLFEEDINACCNIVRINIFELFFLNV